MRPGFPTHAASTREVEQDLVKQLGLSPEESRRIIADLSKEPAGVVKSIEGKVHEVADGHAEVNSALAVVIESIMATDRMHKEIEAQLGAFEQIFDKKRDEFSAVFTGYTEHVQTRSPEIKKKLAKQRSFTLAIYGKAVDGRNKLLGFVRRDLSRAGYRAGELDQILARMKDTLARLAPKGKLVRSKAENVEEMSMELIGLAQQLVALQRESEKHVHRFLISKLPEEQRRLKRGPAGEFTLQESLDRNAEVAIAEPGVEEAVTPLVDPTPGLVRTMTLLDMFEANLDTLGAALEDLDRDVETFTVSMNTLTGTQEG